MPQQWRKGDYANPAHIKMGTGVLPSAVPTDGTGVAVEGGRLGPVLDVIPADLPVPSVTFGAGAPGGTPLDGALYFDTTLPTYVGYVGNGGAWNPF